MIFARAKVEALAQGSPRTLCKHYVIARQLGTPNILDDDEMDIVLEKFSTHGQQA